MPVLTVQEIAQQLGPRQFINVCSVVDHVHGNGTKFDVLSIVRLEGKITVHVVLAGGNQMKVEI